MASVVSATLGTNGKVTVTYSDGSTRVITKDQANKENIKYLSGTSTTGSQQSEGGLTPQSGLDLNTVTDPTTGQTVDAGSVVFTKDGPKTVVELLTSARNDPKVLGKIRTQLVANGLLSKTTRSPSSVLNAYTQVLVGASGSKIDPVDYMVELKKSGFGQDIVASQPSKSIYPTIKSATDLASDVTRAFKSVLGRDPSAEEIAQYSKDLTSQLSKKENQPVVTYVNKNGVLTQTTTTGLDTIQYLSDKLKNTKEFQTLKASGLESAKQKVLDAAKNNAIFLSDADLNNYAERVRNGESVDDIAATFRQIAGVSQPKNIQDLLNKGVDLATIYQPYKSAMAKTLELNPDAIELNDPALANAITGDKTMTSYEFQNSLRKDPRWQYTANAHDAVSGAVEQVLKDFGFMG